MKKIFLIICIFFVQKIFSQSLVLNEEGIYQMQKTIVIDSTSKSELFAKCLNWVVKNYRSANDVVQLQDKENGKIIVKAIYHPLSSGYVWQYTGVRHTIIIDVKDGKVRITINPLSYTFKYEDYKTLNTSFAGKKKVIELTEIKVSESIQNFSDYMLKKIKSDW